jgi:hypothetical protein
MFDQEMNARLSEGVAEMHRLIGEALRVRLPSCVADGEIASIALLVELALDGLMINLVTRNEDPAHFRSAWALFAERLLAGADRRDG